MRDYTFEDLLLYLSGAHIPTIKADVCEVDRDRYRTLGIFVAITGVVAMSSGAYAIYTGTDSVLLSLIFGVLWGLLVVSVDRVILRSISVRNARQSDLSTAGHFVLRLALAAVLASIVAVAVELYFYRDEINAEMNRHRVQQAAEITQEVDRSFPEIESLEARITSRAEILREQQARVDSAFDAAYAEGDGTGGSGITGLDSRYREKLANARLLRTQMDSIARVFALQDQRDQARLDSLRHQRDQTLKQQGRAQERADGFLAQYRTFARMKASDPATRSVARGIFLLLLAIEVTPILMKTISPPGIYEVRLAGEIERGRVRETTNTSEDVEHRRTRSKLAIQRTADIEQDIDQYLRAQAKEGIAAYSRDDARREVAALFRQLLSNRGREEVARYNGDRNQQRTQL